jgi:hypothetical protein
MRPTFRFLVASASVLLAGACSDAPTEPALKSFHPDAPSGPVFDFSGGGSRAFGDQTSDFAVTARGGTFSVNGIFSVNFPANSVCSPDRSTYGPTEWDKSCSTLGPMEAVKITARIRLTSTGLAVDFSPALRFSPDAQVTLSTEIFNSVLKSNRAYFTSNPDALDFLAMSYSQSFDGPAIADYTADKSLLTHVNLETGSVWRRVKHFSGYAVGSGDSCTPSPDNPQCVWVDDKK